MRRRSPKVGRLSVLNIDGEGIAYHLCRLPPGYIHLPLPRIGQVCQRLARRNPGRAHEFRYARGMAGYKDISPYKGITQYVPVWDGYVVHLSVMWEVMQEWGRVEAERAEKLRIKGIRAVLLANPGLDMRTRTKVSYARSRDEAWAIILERKVMAVLLGGACPEPNFTRDVLGLIKDVRSWSPYARQLLTVHSESELNGLIGAIIGHLPGLPADIRHLVRSATPSRKLRFLSKAQHLQQVFAARLHELMVYVRRKSLIEEVSVHDAFMDLRLTVEERVVKGILT